MKRLLIILTTVLLLGCAPRRKIVVNDRGFFDTGHPVSYTTKTK